MTRRDALAHALGYRGRVLLAFGVAWVAYGVNLAVEPPLATSFRWSGLFHEALPIWLRVLLWSGSGTVSIIAAFMPRGSKDSWGFVAVMFMPAERMASYLVGYFSHLFGGTGSPAYLASAFLWAAVVSVVLVCAQWPEPDRRAPWIRSRDTGR